MTNRLAQTQSLYLRKHAENPIDWWYWCDEALLTAKNENKPIFLSIGYSSCHWCTVMEGEAFSDKAIAEYLNEYFLPIKVDREERPDIDSIYMQALQLMTGQGGWPLNIFLTPEELIPFYGGTYFPLEPRYGRAGFLQILEAIRRFYDVEKDKLQAIKQEIFANLQSSTILPTVEKDVLNRELLERGMEVNTAIIAGKQINQPSFPMIPYAMTALARIRFPHESSRYDSREQSRQRGEDLALGGIFDHVAGGFHRYTVDANWTVPHFEKMLYDNGQIMEYLANLYSAGMQEPAFIRAIDKTVSWLKREMTAPQGYFYAAQDADSFLIIDASEPEEGAFYVWSYEELTNLLNQEELRELEKNFTVTIGGNFEGKNVLQRLSKGELSVGVENTLSKLFFTRYGINSSEIFPPAINNEQAKNTSWQGRIPPVTDTKMIVAWNSLMISGLARAACVFKENSYLDLAVAAIEFILEHQWVEGRLHRLNYQGEATVFAQAEDYAFLIKALLDLHACAPENPRWLEKAMAVQQEFDEFLWSVELGGYYNSDSSADLLIRERSYIDNATPAPNGIAIANLVRLSLLTDDENLRNCTHFSLQAFSSIISESPQACPSLYLALNWYLNGKVVRTNQEQLNFLQSQYLPTTVYRLENNLPDNSIALVCHGLSCLPPAKNQQELLGQII